MTSRDDTTQLVADSEASERESAHVGGPHAPRRLGSHVSDNDSMDNATSLSASGSQWSFDDSDDDGDDADDEEEQEGWLTYTSLPLVGLDGHHVMLVRAFRRFLVVGTNQGALALVAPHTGRVMRVYYNHADPIADCACDVAERYLASCDKAGAIAVQSITDDAKQWRKQTDESVPSITLHPLYSRLDDRPLLYATADKVVLSTKSVLWHSRRETVLASQLGRVYQVRWGRNASIVAWLSDRGLTIYSYRERCVVSSLPLPTSFTQPRSYPSTLLWESAQTLLCGWGDWVQQVRVVMASGGNNGSAGVTGSARVVSLAASAAPAAVEAASTASAQDGSRGGGGWPAALLSRSSRYVAEVDVGPLCPSTLCTEAYAVCGLAPFGTQRYLLLTVNTATTPTRSAGDEPSVEVRVVERDTLEDRYRGRLPMQYTHPLQLSLGFSYGQASHATGATLRAGRQASGASGHAASRIQSPRPYDARELFHSRPGILPNSSPQRTISSLSEVRSEAATVMTEAAMMNDGYGGSSSNNNNTSANHSSSSPPLDELKDTGYPPVTARYYVISGDAIVEAAPCDSDDHVDFLLHQQRVDEAYDYAERHAEVLHRHSLRELARQLLEHYAASDAAARLVPRLPHILGTDFAAWEQCIYLYYKRGEAWRLATVLPTTGADAPTAACTSEPGTHTPLQDGGPIAASLALCIGKEYYDLVLLHCLEHDTLLFAAAVHRFASMCNVPVICQAAALRYQASCRAEPPALPEDEGDAAAALPRGTAPVASPVADKSADARRALGEAYGTLLRMQGDCEAALAVFLHVRSVAFVFELLRSEALYAQALQLLPDLFQCDSGETLRLLLEHLRRHGDDGDDDADDDTTNSNKSSSGDPTRPHSSPPDRPQARQQSAAAVLTPEAVLRRLEWCDRGNLLAYVEALRKVNATLFTALAKRHAQLLATLYIEYNRHGLLPFLRSMASYLERTREVFALCKKYDLYEAMVLLLARMGRQAEALRVLVQKMHQMHKAVEFIAEQAGRERQAALFRTLVQLTLEHNASLPALASDTDDGGGGGRTRYVLHDTLPADSYASIAAQYDVPEATLRAANVVTAPARDTHGGGGNNSSKRLDAPPMPCIVPLNLLSALLKAAANPVFAELVSVDASYLLRMLPADEPIPHAARCIAAVTRSRAAERALMANVLHVAETDLSQYYGDLLRRRTAAVRLDLSSGRASDAAVTTRCALCSRWLRDDTTLVVFVCGHVFHAGCLLSWLDDAALLRVPREQITDVQAFLQQPELFCRHTPIESSDGIVTTPPPPLWCPLCKRNTTVPVAEVTEVPDS